LENDIVFIMAITKTAAISISLFLGTIVLSISQNGADGKLTMVSLLYSIHRDVLSSFLILFPSLLAFTTTPMPIQIQTNNKIYNTMIKGRESSRSLLFSTVVETPPTDTRAPVAKKLIVTKKSHQKKKQKATKKKQQKGNTKISTKKSMKKNAPKRSKKSKGKSRSSSSINTRSFKPLKDLKLGSKVSGNVVDVCDFGVFVNIGYATRGSRSGTALLHISQIQSKKITNINDIYKVGDTIKDARVTNIDLKKGEVGLSLRSRRPKRRDISKIQVGDRLEGKVDSVVPYGVFVDIGADVNPLLHISRITGGAIENVRHHLNEGDPVSVHVIDIDVKRKTIAVSMLDKKADQYLDRRMSQRLKRYYGTARTAKGSPSNDSQDGAAATTSSDLDYFDQAIKELEDALKEGK